MQDTAVIIAAAGSATRAGGVDKNYLLLGNVPVLRRTVRAFERADSVARVVVVVRPDRLDETRALFSDAEKPVTVTAGGEDRQSSVRNGLEAAGDCAYIAVHDGARSFVTPRLIEQTIAAARQYGAAAPALPVTDTVKRARDGFAGETIDRTPLRTVQTPQVFSAALYREALDRAEGTYTDDCQLVEQMGRKVFLVEGDPENRKLTTRSDCENAARRFRTPRTGLGIDAHRLVRGRALVLCGVEVPYELGLLGHSDADVATHALMDALLGAAALGDIGQMFPDSDDRYLGADSLALLREVLSHVRGAGYELSNADVTIVAQAPKLSPFIPQMRQRLAEAMDVEPEQVSVKATTTERMGYEGRGEGISAEAVCMLV